MSSTITSSSTISSSATASPTGTGTSGSSSSSGPSSPLLFFVALGFGVVFTNLWIIVGVKYCFRYNQRNRQRMNGEDPDGVDLGAVPRQHRRRREKKLMTMEEVNEKFPLTKYKAWRTTRAQEGLPTAGGITTTAASRPASIRNAERESKEVGSAQIPSSTATTSNVDEKPSQSEHGKTEALREDTAPQAEPATPADTQSNPRPKSAQSSSIPPDTPIKQVTTNDEEAEDDDHIQTAVPAEQLPDPGDACAICIDTIEDDDDVRGLHCGHAFHASCVDPWLTSRRACCPLCKADYYVPKPRPEGADAEGRRRADGSMPAPPQFAFMGGGRGGQFAGGRRPTMVLPGRFMTIVYDDRDRYGFPRVVREPRANRSERRQASAASASNAGTDIDDVPMNAHRHWRQRLNAARIQNQISSLRGNRGNEQQAPADASPAADSVTPAQLEAGRS